MSEGLTTASTSREFIEYMRRRANETLQTAEMLASQHERIYKDNYARMAPRGDYPDREAMYGIQSANMVTLWDVVDQIVEAEERLEYCGDDAESEEYQHALGELFGLKTVFLSLTKRLYILEQDRLNATQHGLDGKEFLVNILRNDGDSVMGRTNLTRNTNQLTSTQWFLKTNTITTNKITFDPAALKYFGV
jgi:hypothetical protein